MRPPILRLHTDELIVDNFAGGGGASLGIEMALGRSPDIAVNHDPEAIAMHAANHPSTEHHCESVWDVDPVKVCDGRPVAMAWFSPDCKHFSKAKGGKPVEKRVRGLAWVVVKWAKLVKPRVIMLENVEEFQTWGPLGEDNRPCPMRKGLTFRRWCAQLENLGYRIEMRELRACDYGAPTIRKRLFIVARCDGLPIVWPQPTHGAGRVPWRTAAECIEWSIPCPSIFERRRPLAEATLRRIAKGVQRYVIDAAQPFIVPLTHHGDSRTYGMGEPFRTITSANRGELALVAPHVTEHANSSSQRAMPADEPLRTICAQPKGGHFALVAAFLAKHYGGVIGQQAELPLGTITTVDHHSLVASSLVKLYGTCGDGQPVDKPMPTVTATGNHIGEVRAFLLKYYGTDQDPQLFEPMHTVTTKHRFGLVTVDGQPHVIADIGMRMLEPRELYRAQGFPDTYRIDIEVAGRPLTKTAQVRMCGNSVSPPIAAAIVAAQFGEGIHEVAA